MFELSMIGISLFIFLLGCIWFVVKLIKHDCFEKSAAVKALLFIGASLFPMYVVGNIGAFGGIIDTLLSAFLGMTRVITGGNSLKDTRAAIGSLSDESYAWIGIYTAVLHVLSSLLVLGFLLSFFREAKSKLMYVLFRQGQLYIFNHISERTVLLAEDIIKNHKAVLVFLAAEAVERTNPYLERLAKIEADIFYSNVKEVKLLKKYRKQEIHFFLMKENDEDNMKEAMSLADHYKDLGGKCHLKIHLLHSSSKAFSIVDAIEHSEHISIRLIRESQLLIANLLDERPLFLAARQERLKVLLVGAGNIGIEALRTVSWCGHTVTLQPRILVVDENSKREDKIRVEYPELITEEGAISFHRMNVESSEFYQLLKEHADISYIICALGDDTLNLKTGMRMREYLEGVRYQQLKDQVDTRKAQIHIYLSNPFLYQTSKDLRMDGKKAYDLEAFGNLAEIYTWDRMLYPRLDYLGKAVNRFYARDYYKNEIAQAEESKRAELLREIHREADSLYYKKEYNRNSSIALGMHTKYKIYSCVTELIGEQVDPKLWREEISHELIDYYYSRMKDATIVEELAKAEHRRWNAYMRSQGWCGADFETLRSWYGIDGNNWKNISAKRNACIRTWDGLDELDQWLKTNYGEDKNFKELDRIMVRAVAEIAWEARKLKGID